MHSFYFVRHGQTDANVQGLMCGSSWDIDINSVGITQAETAAKILSQKIPGDVVIYCSPMLRARHTAEIIARPFQVGLKTIPDLREWDMGAWEGLPFEEVKADFLGNGEPHLGEKRFDFRCRVQIGLEKCKAETGKTRIVVAHGAVWLAVQEILGLNAAKMENGVPFYVYQNELGHWRSERLGEPAT